MSMKKILMTAVAVSALSVSAANALTVTNATTTIGGVNIAPTAGTVPEAYTIANEFSLSTATVFTGANQLVLVVAPTAGSIGVGQYLVSFNISGGTFDTSGGVTTANLVPAGGTSAVSSTSAVGANTISFLWNVTASNPTSLTFSIPVKTGTTRTPIVVGGSVVTQSGFVNVDGGTIPSTTIVDYRDGLTFAATKANPALTLASAFKLFTGAATEANIGAAVKFAANVGTNATDIVYRSTTGTPLVAGDILSAVLSIGGDLSAFDAKLGTVSAAGSQGADVVATAPSVITASGANILATTATSLTGTTGAFISLAQKATLLVGTESAYTVTPVITLPAGNLPLTYTAKALGSTSFEGNSIYAPWVGDGSNGATYAIRLGNRTTAAIGSVKVSLINPYTTGTSGTVTSTASCEVGPLPASGELLITNAKLVACFGAFKRSDVKVLYQGNFVDITAKLRTVSGGITVDVPMGNGTDIAKAN